MIIAAGLTPKRILGNPTTSDTAAADKCLEPTLCLYARNLLDQAIVGQFKDFAGILLTHGCDCTSREYDVWKVHADVKALHYLHVPLKTGDSAFKFFLTELNRFKTHLEAITGNEITSENLDAAIDLCAQTRALLRELASYRKNNPPAISGSEFFRMVLDVQTSDKETANAMIEAKIEEVKARSPDSSENPRILLTGSSLDYPDFLELIEGTGFDVVSDTMAIGMDYLNREIEKTGDPLADIARSFLNKPPNPTKHPPDGFLDFMLDQIKDSQASAVIYQVLKFCEPYLYDSVFILQRLKEEGYPVLLLEHEYTTQGVEALRTRIEAFKETMGGT